MPFCAHFEKSNRKRLPTEELYVCSISTSFLSFPTIQDKELEINLYSYTTSTLCWGLLIFNFEQGSFIKLQILKLVSPWKCVDSSYLYNNVFEAVVSKINNKDYYNTVLQLKSTPHPKVGKGLRVYVLNSMCSPL